MQLFLQFKDCLNSLNMCVEYILKDEYNNKRMLPVNIRYVFLTSSFRLLQNIKCDKFPIENYQPFYVTPPIEKFAINEHYEKKIIYQRNWCGDTEQFLKSKMAPRHFIANYDKEYAYTMYKTNMTEVVQSEMLRPLPYNFDLLAITGEGVCVNRRNILDFMDREYLTI